MSRILIALTLILTLAVGVSAAGDNAKTAEIGWFDMQHCEMCKSMPQELFSSMSWEQYPIASGVVSITNVTEQALPAYRKAHMDMMAVHKRLEAGENVTLCGSCKALGACLANGASYDYVETKTGDLMVITAKDKEVVAKLHAWAEKNKEEMAKMMKKEG